MGYANDPRGTPPSLPEGALGCSGPAALVPVVYLVAGGKVWGEVAQKAGSGTRAWLTQHVRDLGKTFCPDSSLRFPIWFWGGGGWRPCLLLALSFTVWVALGRSETPSHKLVSEPRGLLEGEAGPTAGSQHGPARFPRIAAVEAVVVVNTSGS